MSENQVATTRAVQVDKDTRFFNGAYSPVVPIRQKLKVATMRPIPHTNIRKMMPFTGIVQTDSYDTGQVKPILPAILPTKHSVSASNPAPRRSSNVYQAKQIISLNPIPLKKHGCGRPPIQLCSEVISPSSFHNNISSGLTVVLKFGGANCLSLITGHEAKCFRFGISNC